MFWNETNTGWVNSNDNEIVIYSTTYMRLTEIVEEKSRQSFTQGKRTKKDEE